MITIMGQNSISSTKLNKVCNLQPGCKAGLLPTSMRKIGHLVSRHCLPPPPKEKRLSGTSEEDEDQEGNLKCPIPDLDKVR